MKPTPGQTVGPFFGTALPYPGGPELVPPGSPGAVRLSGRVLDGDARPVPDALLELWQADGSGETPAQPGSLARDGWTFTGWGRCPTDAEGRYTFTTVQPERANGAAPFVALTVFARGLTDRLFTRAYLCDDPSRLDADPLLTSVPGARRPSLVAVRDAQGWTFDVRLQGAGETVFLDHRRAP